MSFAYYLIDNMTHNGCKIYYKKPIDTTMQPAKELNEKYIYYYKSLYNKEGEAMQLLGKFNGTRNCNSGLRYHDYDYIVMVFVDAENKEREISMSDKNNVFCQGIAEINHQMIKIVNMEYNDYPIYYEDLNLL